MSTLRLAFAGTPELAAIVLDKLIRDNRYSISHVYTQPDRPAGRGRKLIKSPVKVLADSNQLEVLQPQTATDFDPDNRLNNIDVLIVVAYGMILPQGFLTRPKFGSINIHLSLLPRWRGAAPIQRAIAAGDKETGISIMQMDSGLDTGDILLQKSCPILPDDTAGSLHDRMAILAGDCLLEALDAITRNALNPVKQKNKFATYAKKIIKKEADIDWSRPAIEIERLIRAFNPIPIAYTTIGGKTIRIWRAVILERDKGKRNPGDVISYSSEGLDIATGDKILRILKLQLPGKKILSVKDFYHGNPDFA